MPLLAIVGLRPGGISPPIVCLRLLHTQNQQALTDPPEVIHIGCEKNAVLSFTTEQTVRAPKPQRIVLMSRGRTHTLHSLRELEGYVDVKKDSQALKFVRLRTCLAFRYAWDDPEQMLEVIEKSEIAALPNYDLPDYARFLQNTLPAETASGRLGILSHVAYKAGRFTPAIVHHVKNGFSVTRWVLLRSRELRLEKIQEFVGVDGIYKKTVLLRKRPSRLPDTVWVVPGRR